MPRTFDVTPRQAALWAAVGECLFLASLIGSWFIYSRPALAVIGIDYRIAIISPIILSLALVAFFIFLYKGNGDIPNRPGFRVAALVAAGGSLAITVSRTGAPVVGSAKRNPS